jgi:hypothetical protein
LPEGGADKGGLDEDAANAAPVAAEGAKPAP